MSPGRLDAIRREIGLIMGWEAQSLYRTPVCRAIDTNPRVQLVEILLQTAGPPRTLSKRLDRAVRRLGAATRGREESLIVPGGSARAR